MSESSKTGAPADSYVFSITQYVFGVNHFMQVFLDFIPNSKKRALELCAKGFSLIQLYAS